MSKKTVEESVEVVHPLIMSQKVGDSFIGVYYVESAYVKLTQQQKEYTDLMLRDKSGARNIKYWGKVDGLASGDFVLVQARVDEYQGAPSMVAKTMEKVEEPDDLTDYVASFDNLTDYESRLALLVETVVKLEAQEQESTCTLILGEAFNQAGAFWQRFVSSPASDSPYYGRTGGLLVSTVTVAENALAISERYGFSDMEKALLVTSALLHRFGAVDAFGFENCMPKVTKKGMLIGVENLTFNRLSTIVRKVSSDSKTNGKSVSQDSILRVLHAVSSYLEKSTKPMTREAIILASVAKVDGAIVEAFNFIESDLNTNEEFTAYDTRAGRKYYRG